MQRFAITSGCLILLGGSFVCQGVHARTQCETAMPGSHPVAEKTDSSDDHAGASEPHVVDAKPTRSDEASAAGAPVPSSGGGGDVSGNLGGAATGNGRKHGLRWQSFLPGVIK